MSALKCDKSKVNSYRKIRGEKNLQKRDISLGSLVHNSAPSQYVELSFTTIGMFALNSSSLYWKFRLANKGKDAGCDQVDHLGID